MKTSDTSEKGLEAIIVNSLIEEAGYIAGKSEDFNRDHAIDTLKLFDFIQTTQPENFEKQGIVESENKKEKFLNRLQGEITKRGVIDVLRKGISDGPLHIDFFYGSPSPGNARAEELYQKNIFSVTRQLHYSKDASRLSLDMAIFINGLPFSTFELKNKLTKQTMEDSVEQYKNDRDPRELLFQFGRCAVHFALDDHQVKMCTELKGKVSWFLPFNKGYKDGAGNPPNPDGLATDYLWKNILTKESLSDIIENFAQIVEKTDERTGKKKKEQIFPRFHQLNVVHSLLADALKNGVGKKYLIQHSAGSGKSNSITWLAHQLFSLKDKTNPDAKEIFDTVIVVTDRRILDKQLRDNIKRFSQVSAIIGAAIEGSSQLKQFIQEGKKVIITTVQKFPHILDEIGDEHRDKKFAIIIDEAHSSQSGRSAAKMNMALAEKPEFEYGIDEEETVEDKINRIMASRKMMKNASYFAFTATPKNKTLETFGESYMAGDEKKFKPFHTYTMKQAIQEGFILDVLQNYISYNSYYRLIKTIEDDPEFDKKKAKKKLRKYVESHDVAIGQKAEVMVDHFLESVYRKQKIGGKARAMVVCNGIERAIQYFLAFNEYLIEIKSPLKAIVAFSGEKEYGGKKLTESSLNNFPSNMIPDKFQEDPYRFLIVADKFQTGFDEPLLHTMYVDKTLSGIKAVQTLSRLNRAHPQKYDTFVLDFINDTDIIKEAFQDYYKTTILSDETDANRLHDLKADLDKYQVFSQNQVDEITRLFLSGSGRDQLDPILDVCVVVYNEDLDEDGQIDFKAKAKAFGRSYNFLASILPYSNSEWEKLSIILNLLVPKLPAPKEDDLARGIIETIDMDTYRVEKQAEQNIILENQDTEIEPMQPEGGGGKNEPEMDKLSNIIRTFNDLFGDIEWNDDDKIGTIITEELPRKVAADVAYQNAINNNDKQNARIEHDKALERVIVSMLNDHTELFKQFMDNSDFKKWLTDTIFHATYDKKSA